ncbi:MAG TPA: hypothetical protein VLC10_05045 [Patescibacteria group bacterium]|nr:hypothetical protein [Patescibacteria group bacterium]
MDAPLTAAQAVQALVSHIDRCGGEYSDWYVSMSANPERDLFQYHLVDPHGQYAYCRCTTFAEARDAVQHLRTFYRVTVGPSWGSGDALYIYAYKMSTTTRD